MSWMASIVGLKSGVESLLVHYSYNERPCSSDSSVLPGVEIRHPRGVVGRFRRYIGLDLRIPRRNSDSLHDALRGLIK